MRTETNWYFGFVGTGKGYSSPQACSTIASGSGVTLSVPQREVKGTVGQPVNLSVSYVTLTPYSTLKIQWCLFSENTPFVTLSRSNCSPGPVTPRYNCSDHRVTRPSYQHRVHLDPDTGSLWLRDFQSDDSGVYVISVYRDGVNTTTEGNVTLTVYNETDVGCTTQPGSTTSQPLSTESIEYLHIIVSVVGCFLIVLILFILVTKKYKGSCLQHDSVAMETHDQPIEGMRQDFAEGQDSVLNGDLTYSLLQWSEHRIPAASGGDPQDSGLETIYAFPQKVNRR
ncbi:uncharacterized protein LOC122541371 isoform X2 [Chiloscyllium plagiosum]|uniref:uncharacterized protein LOC122541371 isoform X2 n=1 Tax=Chiloscyllium plagiosum TaxID=36176 RepID=UPI001CB7B5C5|nr:uncharacterized protein LOC122541371 isoform X2 [Chiloscyllium plagiosum]XP_043534018.1 uncharacterized protein LOC122541371 isoform X2 [Chiloscyllium plagiosum]XP_043534019.1 uncharacterized protein LOC122541371 isoform X2 [Chiloscyllium plagiosum]